MLAAKTRLFAFADTIAARNFAGTNDCHGWIGVRFQDHPQAEPSDILLHVNLRDNANLLQQEAVGILGVNLLHALLGSERAAPAICLRGCSTTLRMIESKSIRSRCEAARSRVATCGDCTWPRHATAGLRR